MTTTVQVSLERTGQNIIKRCIDNKLLFDFEKYLTTLKSVHKKALNIADNSGGAQ